MVNGQLSMVKSSVTTLTGLPDYKTTRLPDYKTTRLQDYNTTTLQHYPTTMSTPTSGIKVIATNKRATFDFQILEKFEAGLALTGTEIKSIRANQVNLRRSYVQARQDELWLVEAHISPYIHGSRENHDPTRPRKLLLHRREINKIMEQLQQKSLTVIPTRLYLKDGRAKLEIALARGKQKHDKRQDIAKRDDERRMERALREKYRDS